MNLCQLFGGSSGIFSGFPRILFEFWGSVNTVAAGLKSDIFGFETAKNLRFVLDLEALLLGRSRNLR